MFFLNLGQRDQLAGKVCNRPCPLRKTGNDIPITGLAGGFPAELLCLLSCFAVSRNCQQEFTYCSSMRLVSARAIHEAIQRRYFHIEPSERAGFMIMTLGQNGLQSCQALEGRKIDLAHMLKQRLARPDRYQNRFRRKLHKNRQISDR